MKKILRVTSRVFFISVCILLLQTKSMAQDKVDFQKLAAKIASKDFVFVAKSLTSTGGVLRILTDPYDMKISADSIVSYLPYFGNAQQAPSSPEDAGIMFTSKSYDYTAEPAKKKSWDISIKFKDLKNTAQFNLTIYDNGEASLNVTSNYRDPISFRGFIKM